jgi:Tol biopolymer transport system component
MRFRSHICSLAALVLAAAFTLLAADKPDPAKVMFEAAKKKELIDGDLNAAIAQYKTIVSKFAGQRAVVADALIHMAECYQKLGDAQASKIFEQVLNQYGDQKEAVATARAHLGGAGPSGGITKRQVSTDACASANGASISLDGRWMTMTDPEDAGNLAIRDMSTGQIKRLLADTGAAKGFRAMSPVLSPDMRQIVYFLGSSGARNTFSLRVVPNETGGQSRLLMDNSGYYDYFPLAWSHDGKSVLLTLERTDRTWQIAWSSVADGSIKVIKSLDWRKMGGSGVSLSPDGRYIAYSAFATNPKSPIGPGLGITLTGPGKVDLPDSHIYIMNADGTGETEVVKTAGSNDRPVWAPDGGHILFTSDIAGSADLWSLAVQNGKPAGAPSLVTRGAEGMGATLGVRTGSYYYHAAPQAGFDTVTVAEMGSGRVSESFVGGMPAWSPDGKSIAFKRHLPGGKQDAYELIVHSVETGEERVYTTGIGSTGYAPPRWSNDSNTLLTGYNQKLYRINVRTGEFTEMPGIAGGILVLSRDDKTLFARVPGDYDHISAFDLETGQHKPIATLKGGQNTIYSGSLSPDGRELAFREFDPKTKQASIARVGIDGSSYREVYTDPQNEISWDVKWSKDGRWIYFQQRHAGIDRTMRIPAEGGTPEFAGVQGAQNGFDLSPDGSRIVFGGTTPASAGGIWALDNILSLVK